VPKPEAQRDTIEIKSGRRAGGLFYSPRTYFRKEEIWLCYDCYKARSRRRGIRVIGGVAILLIAAVFFLGGMKNHRSLLTHLSTPTGP
jgi:heterodisulfide reductase subunit C